jgi:hypothetical protein
MSLFQGLRSQNHSHNSALTETSVPQPTHHLRGSFPWRCVAEKGTEVANIINPQTHQAE